MKQSVSSTKQFDFQKFCAFIDSAPKATDGVGTAAGLRVVTETTALLPAKEALRVDCYLLVVCKKGVFTSARTERKAV